MGFSMNSRKHIPDSSDETRPDFRNTVVSGKCVSLNYSAVQRKSPPLGRHELTHRCNICLSPEDLFQQMHSLVKCHDRPHRNTPSNLCLGYQFVVLIVDHMMALLLHIGRLQRPPSPSLLSAVASMSQTWDGHLLFVPLYHGCVEWPCLCPFPLRPSVWLSKACRTQRSDL